MSDCDRMRELAPELALGIADGEQRAWALDHLAGCAECRAHLESLAAVADELLLLAPALEPPLGFEQRLADRAAPRPAAPRRRRRRFALVLAGALGAAVLAAGGVWIATSADRELAADYRAALARVDGRYFGTFTLEAPGGREAGDVFAYAGTPSWAYVVASPPASYPDGGVRLAPGHYAIELVGSDGERVELATMRIGADGRGSGGGAIPGGLDDLTQLRLLDPGGREVAEASLEH